MTSIAISIAILLFALGLSLWSWRKEVWANIRLQNARIMKEATEEYADVVEKQLAQLPRTCYNPERYDLVVNNHNYQVRGYYRTQGGGEYPVAIKTFRFDDDKDFALLEANELLEHLNEKP